MKGSFSCRLCGRWLEGEWSAAGAELRAELERQMHQGRCDVCPPKRHAVLVNENGVIPEGRS